MWTEDDRAMAVDHSVDVDGWCAAFEQLMRRVGGRFGRVEPRRRAGRFMLGLLAGLPRTTCWSIAEHTGEARHQARAQASHYRRQAAAISH